MVEGPVTLSLGGGGEQTAAVLPGREEVSVVLSSWLDSGLPGHSSLSEADSLGDSRDSKAEALRPAGKQEIKGRLLLRKTETDKE